MYLPHQEPIRYVNEINELNNDFAKVTCTFNTTPTLAMVCEAAAQATAAYKQYNNDNTSIGFVVSYKNCKILQTLENIDYIIKITPTQTIGNLSEFEFELVSNGTKFAIGNLIITYK